MARRLAESTQIRCGTTRRPLPLKLLGRFFMIISGARDRRKLGEKRKIVSGNPPALFPVTGGLFAGPARFPRF